MLKLFDIIPLAVLIGLAIMFAVVPFEAPHLLEKLGMLAQGTLVKPIDIFDLFMHSTPSVLLIIRLTRMVMKK